MTTPSVSSADRAFPLMGTHMRIVVGAPATPGLPSPEEAATRVRAFLEAYNVRLSRFRPDSELSLLNADPRATVPASALLRSAMRAALGAAEATGGLVDPTVLDDLLAVGYTESWDQTRRLDLAAALAEVGTPRVPGSAHPAVRWREVRIDDAAGTITRPPGLLLDTGGTGKGHAADLAGELLAGYEAWAVDCGGDLRIGGELGLERNVEIEHPFTGETMETVRVRRGAVATSGLRSRIWRGSDGEIAHHLLDPASGRPAFTGLVAATALAPTAVEAEALAKAALLAGPRGARLVLSRHGGITVDEDGNTDHTGHLEPPPRVTFRIPTRSAA